jgi:hypothetical protein
MPFCNCLSGFLPPSRNPKSLSVTYTASSAAIAMSFGPLNFWPFMPPESTVCVPSFSRRFT